MYVKNCVYNPLCDRSAVEPFGYVNLVEAVENGTVPSSINNVESEYNDIEDPSTIIGKPGDIFELYRMNDYIKTNGVDQSSAEEEE